MFLQILTSIILALIAYIFGRFNDNNKQIFDIKLKFYSEIVYEINSLTFLVNSDRSEEAIHRNKLIKLFAPARLIGSKSVINETREYFSLICEYYNSSSETLRKTVLDKITISAMELEQCMRKDLSRFRHLSKKDILNHLKKE